ncbi:MAG: sugar transferase [Chloroflexi bacterium]|nr:sugar transferase [Chloroflexota bacterium]
MKERRLFLVTIDLLLVNLAVLIAFAVWAWRGDKDFAVLFTTQIYWFALLSALWLAAESLAGLYDLRVAGGFDATTRALAQTFLLVLVAYLAIFFAIPTELPRGIVVYHGVAAVALIALWRALFIHAAPRLPFRRRALIIGAGGAGQTIARVLRAQFSSHYEIVGFVDDDAEKKDLEIEGFRVLGGHRQLVELARENRVAEIILAITHGVGDDLFRTMLDAQELGIEIVPMPVLYEQIAGRVPVEHIGESWYVALPLTHAAMRGLFPLAKRALDVIAALVGLALLAFLSPLLAIAIRLDSRGAIFYAQDRVGQGGKIFRVFKLRTMIADAEPAGEALWAREDDPRITRIGKILRRTHLDEFPQFWNILRGEMSLVGPRPERPEIVAQLEKQIAFYRLRHAVKPGISGWAIVNAGYVDSVAAARVRVEYDLYYIKHQSLWLDAWIVLRTVGQVVALRGR